MRIDQRYELVRFVGQGAMGSVYEAVRLDVGQRVAVKLIKADSIDPNSEAVRRFRREARAASACNSEHIIRILDSGSDSETGLLYHVMDYLEGEDLQKLFHRMGPLPADLALRIAAQALRGLHKAHDAGIIHRDMKPENLFLARQPSGEILVKLLDFGLAKIKPDPLTGQTPTDLSGSGQFLGSPIYMSPEQILASPNIDARTDLWSLGTTLFHVLVGHPPHGSMDSLGLLLHKICTVSPRPIHEVDSRIPREVADIVVRALKINRDERYSSAADMLTHILQLLPHGIRLDESTFSA